MPRSDHAMRPAVGRVCCVRRGRVHLAGLDHHYPARPVRLEHAALALRARVPAGRDRADLEAALMLGRAALA